MTTDEVFWKLVNHFRQEEMHAARELFDAYGAEREAAGVARGRADLQTQEERVERKKDDPT
jgi:hypothetical protein